MANLTLCRLARSVTSFSRLVPRNDKLFSTHGVNFLQKSNFASPFSTCLQYPVRVSTGILPKYSRKVLSELPVSALLQNRAASTVGDHVRLWQVERVVAAAFIALLPGCIILQNPIVDGLFAMLVVMHAHWGLEAVVVDYARPRVVGAIFAKATLASLYILSAATLVGLLALIYNGPGIGKTVRDIWSIGGAPPSRNEPKN